MDETANLGLPCIAPAQAQKHVTHNEALRMLDAVVQLSVIDRDLAAPPGGEDEGDRFIVAAGASGDWSGEDGSVAVRQDGGWDFLAPAPGWIAWVEDESTLVFWSGSAWTVFSHAVTVLQNLDLLGIGTTADAANPFAARLNKALWTALATGEGGDGDLRYTLNKEAAGNVLSLLMQSNWSGRAELGLIGNDDLTLKVSPDGSAWTTALAIDRTSGASSWAAAQLPAANDGAALGSASHSWADLFLASSAVVNFANGNYTVTHSSGTLLFSGNLRVGAAAALGKFGVDAGDAYFGDEANTARHIYLRRNAVTVGGMGTANSVLSLFGGATAASHLTISSGGNVGVGVNTAAALFSVGTSSAFRINSSGRVLGDPGASGAGNLSWSFVGDTDTGFYRPNADEMAFQTGGTTRLTLSSSALNAAVAIQVGGTTVVDASKRHVIGADSEYTAANIASSAHAVNTTGKLRGLIVWDTTNNRALRASGAGATDPWHVLDGSATVTPS